MFVIVDSLTGNTLRFAKKLSYPSYHLGHDEIPFEEGKFFLLTRTMGFGKIPKLTGELLKAHKDQCIGVAVSGNRNWGAHYGAAGDKIEEYFKIPLVLKFEGSGFPKDWERVEAYIKEHDHE